MFVKKEAAKHGIVIDGATRRSHEDAGAQEQGCKDIQQRCALADEDEQVTVFRRPCTISAPGKVSIKSSSGETQEIETKTSSSLRKCSGGIAVREI